MTNAYTQLQLSFSVPVGIGAYTHLKNQMCKAFFFFWQTLFCIQTYFDIHTYEISVISNFTIRFFYYERLYQKH